MSPEEWYKNLPPLAKIYWTAAVATTVLTTIGVLSPQYLYLDFDLIFGKFQIWRLFTNFFFFGPPSMGFIFQVVLLVRYVSMLEERFGRHLQGTADMLTMFLFGMVTIWVLTYFLLPNLYFYGPSLVFMCIYVWSRSDPFGDVMFYGFSFKAWHTPFLFMGVGMLLGGSPMLDLVGIIVGHTYYFCMELVPRNWNKRLLFTPKWMLNLVQQAQAKLAPAAAAAAPNTAAPRPHWQRGEGHRLG